MLRNAGGEVTDDVLRSLTISQHEPGTPEITLIHHAQCGMQTFTNKDFKAELAAQTGHKPHWASLAFTDVDDDLRKSIVRVKAYPFLNHTHEVRGRRLRCRDGQPARNPVTPGRLPRSGSVAGVVVLRVSAIRGS